MSLGALIREHSRLLFIWESMTIAEINTLHGRSTAVKLIRLAEQIKKAEKAIKDT